MCAIGRMDASGRNVCDFAVGKMDIGLCKGFKITLTRSDATTAKLVSWYEFGAKFWVVFEFGRHLRTGKGFGFLVFGGSLDKLFGASVH